MWNPRRVASCMTRSGKPQMPQEKGRAVTPKEAQQEPIPHPAGGEEEDTAPPAQKERNPAHIDRDHQRWGPAAKTNKASYRRRERSGEQTDGAKKATPKA